MVKKFRLLYLVFVAIIFTAFAALQLNDPDPVTWVLLYMAIASLPLLIQFFSISKYFFPLLSLLYLTGAAYLWPGTYYGITEPMSSIHPEIELARESLGLLISSVVIATFYFIPGKRHRKIARMMKIH